MHDVIFLKLSFNADVSAFNREQMDMKGQGKFHDLVVETEPPALVQKRDISFFIVYIAKSWTGKWSYIAILSVHPESISEICAAETGNKPKRISPLNEYYVVLEYLNETVDSRVAIMLYKIDKWCGLPVTITCALTTQSHLKKVAKSKEESLVSIDIPGLDIATPSVGVTSTHSEDSQRFVQLSQQVYDKIVRYVEEWVWHIESMVQGKILTTWREENNIHPPITNTRVGFGLVKHGG